MTSRRHRKPPIVRALCALLLLAAAGDGGAAAPRRAQLGRCAAFLKRLQERGGRAGIVRPDLYDGLTGFIAMKSGASPDDLDGLAYGASPDAGACQDFGLAPGPLRALEETVAKVPAERLRPAVEGCLAALRVLDEHAEGPRSDSMRATHLAQARAVGRLLGYVSRDRKPVPGGVEGRAEALRREVGGAPWTSPAFLQALKGCEPLGVDTDLLRRTHGVS